MSDFTCLLEPNLPALMTHTLLAAEVTAVFWNLVLKSLKGNDTEEKTRNKRQETFQDQNQG